MKNYLQGIKSEFLRRENTKGTVVSEYYGYYIPADYERLKNMLGMQILVELLKNVNEAVTNQPSLIKDVNLLAEKAINKIDIKGKVVDNHSSYQVLYSEYFSALHTNGLWQMLIDKFVNDNLMVTERGFRNVAGVLMCYLKDLKQREEQWIEQIANTYIHFRDDGRLEIIFPGKLWGGKEMVSKMVKLAEKSGICFVEAKASPINQKIVLPYGWKISNYTDPEGYQMILDDAGKTKAFFRIKRLPDTNGNGEIDFFMEDETLYRVPVKK